MAAVEAWDAWFRWRDDGQVHDRSVADSWQRVSRSLAAYEPVATRSHWERRLLEACTDWRLLLDERILAHAGTWLPTWPHDRLNAVLNPAVFVSAPFTRSASFRHDAFEATAALAVHALDNASMLAGRGQHGIHLQVGLIGLADALAQLGHAYDSDQGRRSAQGIARALPRGCLQESLSLGRERGAWLPAAEAPLQCHRGGRLDGRAGGPLGADTFRHALLTAIEPQPKLALFANNVADAIDPLLARGSVRVIADGQTVRAVASAGYAMNLAGRLQAGQALHQLGAEVTAMLPGAQSAMRNAIQGWIDRPIRYPLAVPTDEPPLHRYPDDSAFTRTQPSD